MDTIGGLQCTGRRLIGPASDLTELEAENGLKHTAIVFHEEYRHHNGINDALNVVLGFLESPLVTGLVELVGHDTEEGAFVYPTGQAWSVAEVIQTFSDRGEPVGIRSGLELMYLVGQILIEAAETGESQGVFSHGGLTPRRILLKKDGQAMLIGYALPQVEILQFHENEKLIPREDSFRYCPPERLEAKLEDLSADLFSLALVAFELMTGRPVYDGLVHDIRQQAARGEGSRRLFRFREVLPDSVRDVLTQALRPEPDQRYESGDDFLHTIQQLLSSPDATGPSLIDVMGIISTQVKRTGTELDAGATMVASRDELLAMVENEEAAQDASDAGVKAWSPPPSKGRRSVKRTKKTEEKVSIPSASEEQDSAKDEPVTDTPKKKADSRWGNVQRSGRRPQKSEEEKMPLPTSTGRVSQSRPRRDRKSTEAPADPPKSATKSSTADLLNRIRQSTDTAMPTRNRKKSRPEESSGDVIQKIMQSSNSDVPETDESPKSKRRSPRRARQLSEEQSPSSTEEEVVSPVAKGKSRRPPRRAKTSEDTEKTPKPKTIEIPSKAKKPTPKAETKSPVEPTPVEEPEKQTDPPHEPSEASEASDELNDVPDASTVALPKPKKPKAQAIQEPKAGKDKSSAPAKMDTAPPKVVLPASTPDAQQVPGSTGFSGAADLSAPPFSIQQKTGESTVELLLSLPGAEQPIAASLPADISAAGAIAHMTGTFLPVRTDLTGAIAGWFRLEVDGKPVPPSRKLSRMDAKVPVSVRYVPNRVVQADISVEGGDTPARFVAPVGSAVPVSSLVDHLVTWLGLPAGDWQLELKGKKMPPEGILADAGPMKGLQKIKLVCSNTGSSAP